MHEDFENPLPVLGSFTISKFPSRLCNDCKVADIDHKNKLKERFSYYVHMKWYNYNQF